MKLCMFSGMFRKQSAEVMFQNAAEIGFEGIELRCRAPHMEYDTPLNQVAELRRMADDYHLPIISAYASFFGRYAQEDDAACEKAVCKCTALLDRLQVLGTDRLTVGCGGPSAFLAAESDYARAAKWLARLADQASARNAYIMLELHNASLIENDKSAVKLLNMIGRDNVGVVHDAGNLYISDDDAGLACIQNLGRRLMHVHIKDVRRVLQPNVPDLLIDETRYGREYFQLTRLNAGLTDHIKVLRALRQTGYSGALSCECNINTPDAFERAQYEYSQLRAMLDSLGTTDNRNGGNQ